MKGTVILALVVLLTIGFLVFYFVCEGFQGVPNWVDDSWTRFNRIGGSVIGRQGSYGGNADTVCKAQQSCSACLAVGKSTDNNYGMQCGWCPKNDAPGAWKCIPRNGSRGIFPSALIDIYSAYNEKTWPGDRTHQVGESCPAYSASNPDSFKYSIGQCPDACSMFSSDCKACASAPACGWCPAASKCVSRADWKDADSKSGSGTACGSQAPSTGSDPSLGSPLANIYTNAVCSTCIVTDAEKCPPKPCSTVTDCALCANTATCGWITSIGKCMKVDGGGKSISEGSSDPNGGLAGVTNESRCPCSSLKECGTCAARPGCGYCAKNKTCVNLDRNNIAAPADCSPGDTRTSPSQCPGSSLGWAIGEGKGLNFGDRTAGPGDSNISGGILQGDGPNDLNDPTYINALKRWNGSVRGTGDGAVSPGTTSRYVGGNGVVRDITDESIRGLNNSPDLTQSPIENYVRMLVRSELASEGIPIIEPFQSPSEVIGNADNFLKDRKSKLSKK